MATAREGGKRSSGSGPVSGFSSADSSRAHVDESKSEHAIRERAYHLWEQSGCPHGRDIEFWLKARKDILGK